MSPPEMQCHASRNRDQSVAYSMLHPHTALHIPFPLLAVELSRLGIDFTFLRRSLLDLTCRPPISELP